MIHHRLSSLQGNAHHIKPGVPIMQPVPGEKKERSLYHLFLFPRTYRFQRRAKTIIRAGFNFDEDHDATIQKNEIQLSNRTAVIPLNDSVAFLSKIDLGNSFPFLPQDLLVRLHAYPLPKSDSGAAWHARVNHSRTGLKLRR